jgi:hypothetical protein
MKMHLALLAGSTAAAAQDMPGATATEIRIGNTDAYSGPASAYGVIAKTETAFFQMVNDHCGAGPAWERFGDVIEGDQSPPRALRPFTLASVRISPPQAEP